MILNAYYDTSFRGSPTCAPAIRLDSWQFLRPGTVAAAFDASSNSVYGVDTTTEAGSEAARLAGPTKSMVIPTSSGIGYAAVPRATFQGFSFIGAVEVMNFSGEGSPIHRCHQRANCDLELKRHPIAGFQQ